jgi:hypothetical protein
LAGSLLATVFYHLLRLLGPERLQSFAIDNDQTNGGYGHGERNTGTYGKQASVNAAPVV